MMLYLDTSALVKLFIEEADSGAVFEAVERSGAQATHLLSYAEACAAFARVERELGRPGWFKQLRAGLDEAWPRINVINPDKGMIQRAATLAHRHALRGYDSVHLAAAEAVHRHGPATFACFDRRLAEAARALGLTVFDG